MNTWKKIKNRDYKNKHLILISLILTMVCILTAVGIFCKYVYVKSEDYCFSRYNLIAIDLQEELERNTLGKFQDAYSFISSQKSLFELDPKAEISPDVSAYNVFWAISDELRASDMYNYNVLLYYKNDTILSLRDLIFIETNEPIRLKSSTSLGLSDYTKERIKNGTFDKPTAVIENGNNAEKARLILSKPLTDSVYLVVEYTYSDFIKMLPSDFTLFGVDVVLSDYTEHMTEWYPEVQYNAENEWQMRLNTYEECSSYSLNEYEYIINTIDSKEELSTLCQQLYLNKDVIFDSSNTLKTNMIIFMSALTAASAVLVFLLYKLLYSPVNRIIKDLPEEQVETNEYAAISRYIDDVEIENKNLKYRLESVESQSSKESFVDKLIENVHAPDDVAAHFDVVLEHPKFVTAVLCGGSQTMLEKLLESFRQKLSEHQIVVYSDRHDSEYVLLLNFDDSSVEKIKSIAVDVLGTHNIKNDDTSNILIGEMYDSLSGFRKDYLKTGEAKLYLDITGRTSTVMTYDDLRAERNHETGENKILDKIQRLISYISVGDYKQAKGITDTVFDDLVNQDSESLESVNAQIAGLSAMIALAVNNKKNLPDALLKELNCTDRLCGTTNIRLIKKECSYIFDLLIEHSRHESIGASKSQKAEMILDYINKNYCNPSLSSNMVAEYANVSAVTVSRLVKDNSGFSYIDYLTKLRIEKVKDLLGSTELTLSDIAAACGYNNVSVMRSAFNRTTGISLVQYRNNLR